MIREFLKYLSLELNRSRMTVQAYENDLRGFNEFIAKSGAPLGDTGFFVPSLVSGSEVRLWMASLSDAGMAPASIRRKVQSLRAFFRFCVKRGELSKNPALAVPLPKISRKLPAIATHDDVCRVLAGSDDVLESLVVELLYGCGLRRSELLGINDEDINPFSRELKILGKGNKHRIVPLPESLLADIRRWQDLRDSLYPDLPSSPRPLIAGKRGRLSESSLYRMVRRSLQPTHAGRKSPHTLRHSFATQLLNSGADINSVKNLLGHSSLGATQIYTHLALSELTGEWTKAHPRAKK